MSKPPKILIAGIGNPLRQDDAFGIELCKILQDANPWLESVSIEEFGIGGIHWVQHLSYGFDILILLDAVHWGGKPGNLSIKEIEVKKLESLSKEERMNFLADMHYANAHRALMLAQALGDLPPKIFVLGCEAELFDDFAIGMSPAVKKTLSHADKFLGNWLQEQKFV